MSNKGIVGVLKGLFRKNQEENILRPVKAPVEKKIPVKERSVQEWIAEWESFYQDVFGIRVGFSNLKIPEKESGFNRLIIMAAGMTPQQTFDKCEKLFPCWKWTSDSFDSMVSYSQRTSKNGAYAVWVRDCMEADEDLKNQSADVIKSKQITTETFEERCVQELKYFKETGEHLDMENITFCTGSRYSNGEVPCISWVTGMFRIRSARPDRAGRELRSRRVVA